jgi:3-deoxy-manno-octulosonate cytidylyltransferase (CMP-KDO synthetase)
MDLKKQVKFPYEFIGKESLRKEHWVVIGIIPARMASTRYPGKPMKNICGIPMIGHVYLRSKMSKVLDEVYVATCDRQIRDYIYSINGKAVMTSDKHERASDRASEAMFKIERNLKKKVSIVVMIQGDEPMLFPEMIGLSVKPMQKDKNLQITNLMGLVKTEKERLDPNTVKVVVDQDNFALYYSREAIPSGRKFKGVISTYKQVPIIPFRRDFLIKFGRLTSMSLERIESVDMLRVLEHGYKVKMVLSKFVTFSVDTPEDLKRVEKLMLSDKLLRRYRKA